MKGPHVVTAPRIVCVKRTGEKKVFVDLVSGYRFSCDPKKIKKGFWIRHGVRELPNNMDLKALIGLEPIDEKAMPIPEAQIVDIVVETAFGSQFEESEKSDVELEPEYLKKVWVSDTQINFIEMNEDGTEGFVYRWRHGLTDQEKAVNAEVIEKLKSEIDEDERKKLQRKIRRDQTLMRALKFDEWRWTRPEYLDHLIGCSFWNEPGSEEVCEEEDGNLEGIIKIYTYRRVRKSVGKTTFANPSGVVGSV